MSFYLITYEFLKSETTKLIRLYSSTRLQTIDFINSSMSIYPVPALSMLPNATSECRYKFLNSFLIKTFKYFRKWCLQRGMLTRSKILLWQAICPLLRQRFWVFVLRFYFMFSRIVLPAGLFSILVFGLYLSASIKSMSLARCPRDTDLSLACWFSIAMSL